MTVAEKLHNEGLKKGLRQGLEQGLFEGIELAVSIKLGETEDSNSLLTKIKTIKDINMLKALKGKIKAAKTIPELMQLIGH